MTKAILVDYRYCTGCHACEVACQVERGFTGERLGIEVKQIGPYALDDREKRWQYDFFPVPTAFCNGCATRVGAGKDPSCVHHCQTGCLKVGDVDELRGAMDDSKMALFTLGV